MKFRLKYLGRVLRNLFVNAKAVWIIELIGILIIVVDIVGNSFNYLSAALLITMLVMPVMIIIPSIANVFRTAPYMEIFEEKGFCREYLAEFERVWIHRQNVTPNFQLVQQAEGYLFLGDTAICSLLLSRIRVPESEEYARAWYLITYMRLAFATKDAALAVDVWNRNYNFINRYISKTRITAFNTPAIVLDCCYAKMLCLQGNYTAALEAIGKALPKKHTNSAISGFYILQTYIYHQLGSPLEQQSALDAQNFIIHSKLFEVEVSQKYAFEALDKACRGEMSIW